MANESKNDNTPAGCGCIALIFFLASCMFSCIESCVSDSDSDSYDSTALSGTYDSPARSGTWGYISTRGPGFALESDLLKWLDFVYSKDYDAGDRFLASRVAVGMVTFFAAGTEVYVEKRTLKGGALVRARGETESWWFYRDAVKE